MSWFYPILILSLIGSACQNTKSVGQETTMASDMAEVALPDDENFAEEITSPSLSYSESKGKLVYDKYCSVCHGNQGQGDGFNAYNLDPRPRDLTEAEYLATLSDEWLSEVVSQGGRGVKRSVLMPSYEKTLTTDQIRDLVAYLRYLATNASE